MEHLTHSAARSLQASGPTLARYGLALSPADAAMLARHEADALCAALNITSRQTGRCLQDTARALGPRLQAALSAGTLEHIFLEA